jgi:molybdate transport system substrate-binding protein
VTTRMPVLRILSAGAAKGLVQALAAPFQAASGTRIEATFDSAGAISNAVTGGAGCDLVILPAAMLDTLAAQALVDSESIAALGRVPTGIAVAAGDRLPDVQDADALKAALVAASALYCPDTLRSTAGIHFTGVLRTLGLYDASLAKLRTYANGAQAMAALAQAGVPRAIGCTQITEILYTPGVVLVAALPEPFELATIYGVAVASNTGASAQARSFAARLTGAATQPLRHAGGFLDRAT